MLIRRPPLFAELVKVAVENEPTSMKYCCVSDGIVVIFGLDFAEV